MSTSSSEFRPIVPHGAVLSDADGQRIAEITAKVSHSTKQGCIYFGICNNRLKIGALEAAIGQSLSPKGIAVLRVILAERDHSEELPRYRIHIPDPIVHLSEISEPGPNLFFIHGLPELIREQTGGDDSKVAPVSQLLNYRRELFHDRALCTFFWLDAETMAYLIHKAPDFWSFRSGTAQFADTPGLESVWPDASRGWQESTSFDRWGGDLQEKLDQLAVYRRKTPPDANAIGNLLLDVGRLHVESHELQKAFDALHEAAAIFEGLKLPRQTSSAKKWLSRAFRGTGQFGKAEEYLGQAIKIDRELEDESDLATDYNDLSQIYQARGQLEEAERWLRKAIEIDERLGNEPSLAILYNNLSLIYQARGQLEEAERWLRKAIEIDERLRNEPKLAIRYNNLSQIYKARGQLEEAERWLRKAIEIDEGLRNEPKLAIRYNNLSQIYKARGQLEEAERWLRKAIEIDERLGNEPSLAIRYNNLSLIYQARGQLEEAERWLRKAIEIDEGLRNEPKLAIRYNNLSVIYRERGQLEEAERWLRKAIALVESQGPSKTLELLKSSLASLAKEQDAKR